MSSYGSSSKNHPLVLDARSSESSQVVRYQAVHAAVSHFHSGPWYRNYAVAVISDEEERRLEQTPEIAGLGTAMLCAIGLLRQLVIETRDRAGAGAQPRTYMEFGPMRSTHEVADVDGKLLVCAPCHLTLPEKKPGNEVERALRNVLVQAKGAPRKVLLPPTSDGWMTT